MKKALIPILTMVTAVGVAGSAAAVDASHPEHRPAEVTHGRFQTLPGGVERGFDIRGGAVMFRSDADGGSTHVTVRVDGLEPNTTYMTHVHDQPCTATPPGGGHYQHEVGGPVDAINEMWPTLTTDSKGKAVGTATHAARAREDARAIVIHWSESTAIRLACLDLG